MHNLESRNESQMKGRSNVSSDMYYTVENAPKKVNKMHIIESSDES